MPFTHPTHSPLLLVNVTTVLAVFLIGTLLAAIIRRGGEEESVRSEGEEKGEEEKKKKLVRVSETRRGRGSCWWLLMW